MTKLFLITYICVHTEGFQIHTFVVLLTFFFFQLKISGKWLKYKGNIIRDGDGQNNYCFELKCIYFNGFKKTFAFPREILRSLLTFL